MDSLSENDFIYDMKLFEMYKLYILHLIKHEIE